MARSIAQIQASIIAAKDADPVIGLAGTNPLNSTSLTAVWLVWTWIVAMAMWVTENAFDTHKAEVQQIIAAQKPHSLEWYATQAKVFQYGYSLSDGKVTYDTIDASAQIIAFAAAVEILPYVRVKVAKLAAGVLAPLAAGELTAFRAYMSRVKDAGVPLNCTSGNPDSLRVGSLIYYDPLIIDATGKRLDGTNDTPVQDAINVFIDTLPFNGVFELDGLIAAIKAVEGVKTAQINYCAAQYGLLPYSPIPALYVPDAGFLLLDQVYFSTNTSYAPYAF